MILTFCWLNFNVLAVKYCYDLFDKLMKNFTHIEKSPVELNGYWKAIGDD